MTAPSTIEAITPEAAGRLRAQLTGTLALPGEPGYDLATPWNVAVRVAPAAVVSAAGAPDIAATVRFAASAGLRVAVQRTGHGALELGGDVILVHTGQLGEITIDPQARTARVGAGAIWQQVIEAAAPFGLAPLCGSSPNVGVVGMLTGGGIGPFVRTYGLSSDQVTAFEVVTGNGDLLRVTPQTHPDLFWGLRGGKGTLGIVTAAEFALVPLPTFYGGALYFDGADAPAVLHAWREWSATLPEHANTSVALLQLPALPMVPPPLAGRLTVAVRYTSTVDAAAAEALLAPIRAAATPILDGIGELPYAAVGSVHADPVDPMPTSEQTAMLRELPAPAIDALLALAGPGAPSPQVVVELRLLGGAYAREGAHPSAFCQRDAAYSLMVIGVLAPPIADIVPVHAAQVVAALQPWATGGRLPNFAPSASAEEIARAYDEDTLHLLSALGDQHDQAGVLRVGQVVRSAR